MKTLDECLQIILLSSLSKLTQLQELDIGSVKVNDGYFFYSNDFSSGSISVIGEMTSLIKLNLSRCELRELPQR